MSTTLADCKLLLSVATWLVFVSSAQGCTVAYRDESYLVVKVVRKQHEHLRRTNVNVACQQVIAQLNSIPLRVKDGVHRHMMALLEPAQVLVSGNKGEVSAPSCAVLHLACNNSALNLWHISTTPC